MTRKIAIAGATGNVGREIINILAERNFPADEVVALASQRSVGKEITYGNKTLIVEDLDKYDFSGTKIALFSPGGAASSKYAPIAAKSGCVVIDNSSFFRMHKDVPLIVPEVNPEDLADYSKSNIIANPNCSTIQMVVALKPLDDIAKIKRIIVATYQSTSGAGKAAMDELFNSTKKLYQNETVEPEKFTKRIAFNAIPHIDVFMEDGATKEEWKMKVETKKIMGDQIKINATCVRIPTFVSHGEAVAVEFESDIAVDEARNALEEADGILVMDRTDDNVYATPVDTAAQDPVYVSRIRKDDTVKNGLNLWVCADNLRKGAALNAVQIAELLVEKYGL
jgi:aspartate-semialdehyde dehydrogenase